MNWSTYQKAIFEWVKNSIGSLIVEAVAGSGKTTTLVEMVRRMPGTCFLGAFNKKMGDELQSRVAGLPGKTAGTLHSAGFRALNGSLRRRPKVDGKKVANLFDDYIDSRPPQNLNRYFSFVVKAISMAKQRGIGLPDGPANEFEVWEEMVLHFGIDNDLPEDATIKEGLDIAQDIWFKSNKELSVIDFDDMIFLPLFLQVKFTQYDWVMVDEAQDTNPVRRMLVKKMLKPGGRVVAVGDPYQAIYGFAGADNDALDKIREEFNCETLPLSITYRCPKVVVAHAKKWVDHIEADESAPEGEIHEIKSEEIMNQNLLKTDAILCRYNKYLVSMCFRLIRNGIAARIEGREIGEGLIKLTKKWKVSSLDALQDRLMNYKEKEIAKALKKKQDSRADRISDQVDTLYVLIERGAEKGLDVRGLETMIRDMFDNDVKGKGILTLSSCHKAKGLEWDRVFILGRAELMPSPYAKQAWEVRQEMNLIYVAVTRTKHTLVEVTGVKISKKEVAA